MGCHKAQGFLEHAKQQILSRTDASKDKRGRAEALALARSVKTVIIGKGKNVLTIDMARDQPDDDTLAGLLLGRSGNLKAPTLRIGNTLLVGFSEAAYRKVFDKHL
jgi:hypothetical protein